MFRSQLALQCTDLWGYLQVVDTTGAGDCFTGAYAVGILEGKAPEEALKFAGWCPWLASIRMAQADSNVWVLPCAVD